MRGGMRHACVVAGGLQPRQWRSGSCRCRWGLHALAQVNKCSGVGCCNVLRCVQVPLQRCRDLATHSVHKPAHTTWAPSPPGSCWAMQAALVVLRSDVSVSPGAPGGRPEYRNSLAASFLFKFFLRVSAALEEEGQANGEAAGGLLQARERSGAAPYHRPAVRGVQFFAKPRQGEEVGQDYRHMSADLQVGC